MLVWYLKGPCLTLVPHTGATCFRVSLELQFAVSLVLLVGSEPAAEDRPS